MDSVCVDAYSLTACVGNYKTIGDQIGQYVMLPNTSER